MVAGGASPWVGACFATHPPVATRERERALVMVAQSSAQSALALLNELISELPRRPAPTTGKASSPPPTAAKPSVAKAKAAAAPTSCSEDELPATVALYQTDTYLLKSDATVLAVEPLDGGEGWAVVLDQTVFHPQGGGQPADVGTLEGESGAPFAVSMVKKGPTGVVRHEGASPTPPPFAAGSRVRCAVSEQPRLLNARVHSAGHLIDVAMTNSGMASRLRPTKGYHFTPGSYVEYEGDKLDVSERDKLLTKLQVCDVYVFVSVYVCALHVYMASTWQRARPQAAGPPACAPLHLMRPCAPGTPAPLHPCALLCLAESRAPSCRRASTSYSLLTYRRAWTSWSPSPLTPSSNRSTPSSWAAYAHQTPSPQTRPCGAAAGCAWCVWAGWAARAAARTWPTRASCAPSRWGPSSRKARSRGFPTLSAE
jgi:hypothetical protein